MLKKRLFLICFILVINSILFCDQTNDTLLKSDKPNTNNYMKFRGSIFFVWDYLFEYQDGLYYNNHFAGLNYSALDYTDKGDPEKKHHSDNGRIIGGGWGGMQFKVYLNYQFIAPFLTALNPLMKQNNIALTFSSEISPITFNTGASITFTPVAFLKFEAGFLIGNGWSFAGLMSGIGLNNNGTIYRYDFSGTHMQVWFSSTFQFDLAALMPKQYQRWSHFVILATPIIKYMALLSISENQPYMYEEDPGENLNGWRFLGDYLLGYRFFVNEDDTGENQQFLKMFHKNFIITIGMYIRMDYLNLSHFYDSPMSNGWGSDFTYINFGPAIQFDFPNNYFLKIFFFFQNEKAFTSDTVGNLYFQERKYQDWYIFFRWCGFFFGWNF